jgi:hypothetical protein
VRRAARGGHDEAGVVAVVERRGEIGDGRLVARVEHRRPHALLGRVAVANHFLLRGGELVTVSGRQQHAPAGADAGLGRGLAHAARAADDDAVRRHCCGCCEQE